MNESVECMPLFVDSVVVEHGVDGSFAGFPWALRPMVSRRRWFFSASDYGSQGTGARSRVAFWQRH